MRIGTTLENPAFQPVTIVIETEEELRELYLRMWMNDKAFASHVCPYWPNYIPANVVTTTRMARVLHDAMSQQGIEP